MRFASAMRRRVWESVWCYCRKSAAGLGMTQSLPPVIVLDFLWCEIHTHTGRSSCLPCRFGCRLILLCLLRLFSCLPLSKSGVLLNRTLTALSFGGWPAHKRIRTGIITAQTAGAVVARRIAALSAVSAWNRRAVSAAAVGQCRQCMAKRRGLCGRMISKAVMWW